MKKIFAMLMAVSFLATAVGLSAAEVTPTAGGPSKNGTPVAKSKSHHKMKKGHWKKKKAMAQATPGAMGKK